MSVVYAWFRSFKAVEVKFWSFLVCLCVFLSGVCCYVNVAVKIFTSSFYLDILAYKQIGKLSKVNGHVSNSTHESKWFSKLIETDVTLSACFASLSLRLCVWVSSQFSRSAAAAAAYVLVCFVSLVVFISFLLRSLFVGGSC